MADVGDPNDEKPKGEEPKGPTAEEVKAARKAALEKFEVEQARTNPTPPLSDDDGEDEIDLSGVDPELARQIRQAQKKGQHVDTLARYGIEQARRVKALELAREFKLEDDEIAPLEKALGSAWTPDALDITARELRIKLREDGSVQVTAPKPQTKPTTETTDGEGNPPPVDQGRGGGSNRSAALQEKIDAIDPYGDPEKNAAELDKLYKEVDAAQKRHLERAARR